MVLYHRRKNWLKQLASAEFAVNNKVHLATKVSSFMANYGRELRMGADVRRRGKIEKTTKFMKRMKKVQEEMETVSRKAQEEMKQQADRERKNTEVQKKEDKVMLNMKDLIFKEQLVKKLVD